MVKFDIISRIFSLRNCKKSDLSYFMKGLLEQGATQNLKTAVFISFMLEKNSNTENKMSIAQKKKSDLLMITLEPPAKFQLNRKNRIPDKRKILFTNTNCFLHGCFQQRFYGTELKCTKAHYDHEITDIFSKSETCCHHESRSHSIAELTRIILEDIDPSKWLFPLCTCIIKKRKYRFLIQYGAGYVTLIEIDPIELNTTCHKKHDLALYAVNASICIYANGSDDKATVLSPRDPADAIFEQLIPEAQHIQIRMDEPNKLSNKEKEAYSRIHQINSSPKVSVCEQNQYFPNDFTSDKFRVLKLKVINGNIEKKVIPSKTIACKEANMLKGQKRCISPDRITPLGERNINLLKRTSGRVLRKCRQKNSKYEDEEEPDTKADKKATSREKSLHLTEYFKPIQYGYYKSIDEELGNRMKRVNGVPKTVLSGLRERLKFVFSKRAGTRVGKTGIYQHSDGMQWKLHLKSIKGLSIDLENFITLNLPFTQEDPLYLNSSLSFLETRKNQNFQRAHLDYFWNHLTGRTPEDLPWICVLPLTEEGMKLHIWPYAGVGKMMNISLGECVFLRGDVVHAGGMGRPASRCHFYLPKFSSDYDVSQGTNWKDPDGKMICHSHFIPRSSFDIIL